MAFVSAVLKTCDLILIPLTFLFQSQFFVSVSYLNTETPAAFALLPLNLLPASWQSWGLRLAEALSVALVFYFMLKQREKYIKAEAYSKASAEEMRLIGDTSYVGMPCSGHRVPGSIDPFGLLKQTPNRPIDTEEVVEIAGDEWRRRHHGRIAPWHKDPRLEPSVAARLNPIALQVGNVVYHKRVN